MINDFENVKVSKGIRSVINGLIISFMITLLFILLLSFILVKSTLSENVIVPGIYGITSISIIIGAILSVKNRGILYGGEIGLVYVITLYVVSSILNHSFKLNFNSIILILVSIASGVIGGIVGSNLKRM